MSKTKTMCCYECSEEFVIQVGQFNYQIKKGRDPKKFFCGLSCTASHGNRTSPRSHVHLHLQPQYGNQYSRKYLPEYSWYVKRIKHDSRSHVKIHEDIQTLQTHIHSLWTGYCNISQIPILLRNGSGIVKTSNKFFIASLDRIDSNKPYEIGNIQWISLGLNLAKGNDDNEKFIENYNAFISNTI